MNTLNRPGFGEFAALGFSVFPCHRNTGTHRDKEPALRWSAYTSRRPTAEELARWDRELDHYNVALVMGEVSGCFAVDIDGPRGEAALSAAGAHAGEPLPVTASIRTARGRHLLFAWPRQRRIITVAGTAHRLRDLLPDVDVRGQGGYIIGPGSRHPSGCIYAWIHHPAHHPIAVAPSWLLDILAPPPAASSTLGASTFHPATSPRLDQRRAIYAETALQNELTALSRLQEGGRRNIALNRAAYSLGQLIGDGLLDQRRVGMELVRVACAIGLPEREAHATVMSGLTAGIDNPRSRRPPRSNPPQSSSPPSGSSRDNPSRGGLPHSADGTSGRHGHA